MDPKDLTEEEITAAVNELDGKISSLRSQKRTLVRELERRAEEAHLARQARRGRAHTIKV